MKTISSFFFAVFLMLSAVCLAGDVKEIGWEDLIASQFRESDPMANLSEEDINTVEWVIYLRANLPEQRNAEEQEMYDEMMATLPKLQEKGIDIDQIVVERLERMKSMNSELDGKQIRLAGYLLPLDLSATGVREFLLVPYVGACIHVPPPPPNQIVHATTAKPIDADLAELYKPVWVTGKLVIQSLSKNLFLGDGSDDIEVGYSMQVESVEEYKES